MGKLTLLIIHLLFWINTGASPAPTLNNPGKLFENDSLLDLHIKGNLKTLFNDRLDDMTYHPITISYIDNGQQVTIPLKTRTRGNFRRQKANCTYPPLLLNFAKETSANTIFEGQDKIKLVMPCGDDDFVVREYLVYKLYNEVTEKSFRARLVRLHFYDEGRDKELNNFYGILLESDDDMAKRNGMKIIDRDMLPPQIAEKESYLRMALFEYMIGNCDWSVPYRHNTRIIAFDSLSIPYIVPYDFDHSGFVSAPYAYPPEELKLSSVRERRFRGYCVEQLSALKPAIDFYNRKKNDFYNIITNSPYASSRFLKSIFKWMDEFYDTINNDKKAQKDLLYPCTSTNEFVIKGY